MRKKDNHDVRHCLILSSVSTLLSFLSHITHHCDQCQLFSWQYTHLLKNPQPAIFFVKTLLELVANSLFTPPRSHIGPNGNKIDINFRTNCWKWLGDKNYYFEIELSSKIEVFCWAVNLILSALTAISRLLLLRKPHFFTQEQLRWRH